MAEELKVAGTAPTIIPNINASNRPLPKPVSASIFNQQIRLDAENQVQFPGDKQLLPLSIAKKDLSITDGEVVTLVVRDFEHRLFDKRGQLVKPHRHKDGQTNYVFSLDRIAAVNLFLEVGRFTGSPSPDASSLSLVLKLYVTHPSFTPALTLDDEFDYSVDTKTVWLAPLRFVTNLEPVEKLFIADLPDNEPTVKELQRELRAIGMEGVLEKVPLDVCKGDAWLQDQYQEGFCLDDRGNTLRVVWHLPRLRSETADADRPNLSTFVDAYFPSDRVGVIKDFWTRTFTLTVGQETRTITFRDTFPISLAFSLVEKLWNSSLAFFRAIESENAKTEKPATIWEQVRYSRQLIVAVAIEYQKSAKKSSAMDNWLALLIEMDKQVRDRFTAIHSVSAAVKFLRRDGSAVADGVVSSEEIERLYEECHALHDSVNYGGNIEMAPAPSADEWPIPVVGTSQNRAMDPAILQFVEKQIRGAMVEIDTSWLKVGHVDELLAFIPAPAIAKKSAVLQNSTQLAFAILLEAVRYHYQNDALEIDNTDWSTINGALVHLGDADDDRFVSDMLRGKYWEYYFDRAEAAVPQLMPPQTYLASQGNLFTGNPDVKTDVFPAALSLLEIFRLERRTRTNRQIEDPLATLTAQLKNELDDPEIVFLPAVFDLFEGGMTETFHPNLVNLQVVGSHVMMPRPFGVRMKAGDAIKVLKKVTDSSWHASFSTDFIKKHRLDVQTLNLRNFPDTDYHQQIPIEEIQVYGYPDAADDFEERLRAANRTEFTPDGYLKDGWRTLKIPEATVDLFEFYTTVALSRLGVTVHWIDTWYYHVRHGGLHCGTNTLRRVPAS